MTDHERHAAEHEPATYISPATPESAEKAVADAIEEAVDVPASIEEQAMLDAAELEEIEAGDAGS